jgi:TolA-binding protein
MTRILPLLVVAAVLGLAACQSGGAAQMLQTAQFEELQHNSEHAAQLYRQILEGYPNSPEATKARQRLAALEPVPPH